MLDLIALCAFAVVVRGSGNELAPAALRRPEAVAPETGSDPMPAETTTRLTAEVTQGLGRPRLTRRAEEAYGAPKRNHERRWPTTLPDDRGAACNQANADLSRVAPHPNNTNAPAVSPHTPRRGTERTDPECLTKLSPRPSHPTFHAFRTPRRSPSFSPEPV